MAMGKLSTHAPWRSAVLTSRKLSNGWRPTAALEKTRQPLYPTGLLYGHK